MSYQSAFELTKTCFCLFGRSGVSSVPRAIEIHSENGPVESVQNIEDPQREQNCRVTPLDDSKACSEFAPVMMVSARAGALA